MAQLSEKELASIQELLSDEDLLVKKFKILSVMLFVVQLLLKTVSLPKNLMTNPLWNVISNSFWIICRLSKELEMFSCYL